MYSSGSEMEWVEKFVPGKSDLCPDSRWDFWNTSAAYSC